MFVLTRRLYAGAAAAGALSQRLMVLRDRPVSLEIALINLRSRWYSPRTLLSIAMVITLSFSAQLMSRKIKHPGQFSVDTTPFIWSVFGRRHQNITCYLMYVKPGQGHCVTSITGARP